MQTPVTEPLNDEQIRAVIGKLIAETAKIQAEAKWFPFVAAGGVFAAAAGFVAVVAKLLG